MLRLQFLSGTSENILKIIRFNAILNVAKKKDKATLQQFISQGGKLDLFLYNKNDDTTPIRFLAANGDDESVDFLIKNTKEDLQKVLINEALQGYASAFNPEKVEEFLKNHNGDIDEAILGFIKAKNIAEVLNFFERRKIDAKNALFHCAIRAYEEGVDSEYARGVQVLISQPDAGKEMKRIFSHIFYDYNRQKKPILRQSLLHLFSCITHEETRKLALEALDAAQRYDRCFNDNEISTLLGKAKTIHHLMQDEKYSFEKAMLHVNEEVMSTIKRPSNSDDEDDELRLQQHQYTGRYHEGLHKNNIERPVFNDNGPNQPHVTLIGDSTIDNKIWVDGLVLNYLKDHLGINRDDSNVRIQKYNANGFMKPELSVVEHLRNAQPVEHEIVDLTNDGFTTADCLYGNKRSKVFGRNTFKLFPNEEFAPLDDKRIQQSSHIFLSIGGNNFREFLVEALRKPSKERKRYIKRNYPIVMDNLKAEYIAIVNKIREINPTAKLILLTQYYPSVTQNNYRLYPFLKEVGEALGFGSGPMDTIHKIMQDTYQTVFKEIINGPSLSLLWADDVNIVEFDNAVKQARTKRIPLLIKFQDEFFIYSDPEGNGKWLCTKLTFCFDDLPFEQRKMKYADLLDRPALLRILSDCHASYNRSPDENVMVVDVTSSLDPYDGVNFINQIEPSGKGGEKIAQMLNYMVHNDMDYRGHVIRFLPGFFLGPDIVSQDNVLEVTPINAWAPIHPQNIKLSKKNNINESNSTNNYHAFQLRDLFSPKGSKPSFMSSLFTNIEVHRARWTTTSIFRKQIKKIQETIQRLDHFYIWNGASKANEIRAALNRAIDASLRGKQFVSIENFQSYKHNDKMISLNEALEAHRLDIEIDSCLKIDAPKSSLLVRR